MIYTLVLIMPNSSAWFLWYILFLYDFPEVKLSDNNNNNNNNNNSGNNNNNNNNDNNNCCS